MDLIRSLMKIHSQRYYPVQKDVAFISSTKELLPGELENGQFFVDKNKKSFMCFRRDEVYEIEDNVSEALYKNLKGKCDKYKSIGNNSGELCHFDKITVNIGDNKIVRMITDRKGKRVDNYYQYSYKDYKIQYVCSNKESKITRFTGINDVILVIYVTPYACDSLDVYSSAYDLMGIYCIDMDYIYKILDADDYLKTSNVTITDNDVNLTFVPFQEGMDEEEVKKLQTIKKENLDKVPVIEVQDLDINITNNETESMNATISINSTTNETVDNEGIASALNKTLNETIEAIVAAAAEQDENVTIKVINVNINEETQEVSFQELSTTDTKEEEKNATEIENNQNATIPLLNNETEAVNSATNETEEAQQEIDEVVVTEAKDEL